MNKADIYYKENLNKILNEGYWDENPRPKYKDGTPAHTKFITQVFEEYDISKGEFPIPTLRNTAIKTGIKEILWIYQKQTSSLDIAHDMKIFWWDEWNIGDNNIGNRYGHTVKKYDLMNKLLDGLKRDPFGRRHIINMYQYDEFNTPGLYPCAYETIWSVRKLYDISYLDFTLVQRSNDFLVAGYINKVQYVALQLMVCCHLGYLPGKFCHLVQNLHIYDRHFDAAYEIINRESIENINPRIELNVNKDFYDITIDDFEIFDVVGIPKIKSTLELAI